jgi:hypothetical protein
MPNLFGIDIAGLVNSSIVGAGGVLVGTLHKRTSGNRTSGQLTSGVNPTFADSTFNGFIDTKTSTTMSGGQLTVREGERVSILGASISPAVVPELGDEVTIEGNRYRITKVKDRDPAGALYVCEIDR